MIASAGSFTDPRLRVPCTENDLQFLKALHLGHLQEAESMVIADCVDFDLVLPKTRRFGGVTYHPLISAIQGRGFASDAMKLFLGFASKGATLFRHPREFVPEGDADQEAEARVALMAGVARILRASESSQEAYGVLTSLGLDGSLFRHLSTKKAKKEFEKIHRWTFTEDDAERWENLAEVYRLHASREDNARTAAKQLSARPRHRRPGL